jgi:hypothetical protein
MFISLLLLLNLLLLPQILLDSSQFFRTTTLFEFVTKADFIQDFETGILWSFF